MPARQRLQYALQIQARFFVVSNRVMTGSFAELSDLVRYLPKSGYSRRAIHKPDGRRCDDGVLQKRVTLHHLGHMRVTRDANRVARSVALSVCADLLLVRLYGQEDTSGQPWSLFRLKQRFHADLMQEQIDRTERKWKDKLKQYEDAA